jgi:hypothetical protein
MWRLIATSCEGVLSGLTFPIREAKQHTNIPP